MQKCRIVPHNCEKFTIDFLYEHESDNFFSLFLFSLATKSSTWPLSWSTLEPSRWVILRTRLRKRTSRTWVDTSPAESLPSETSVTSQLMSRHSCCRHSTTLRCLSRNVRRVWNKGSPPKSLWTTQLWRPGLVTSSIILCWLFAINDRHKMCVFNTNATSVYSNCF